MDRELSNLLLENRKKVCNKLSEIEFGKLNYLVKEPHYLNPIVDENTVVDSDNEKGEIEYYERIQEDLVRLLRAKKVNYSSHFEHAPEEIKQLLNKP